MAKKEHLTESLVERLGIWQRKLRNLSSLVPARKLPLLTPAEAYGPDLDRFRDASQSLLAWRDKQSQSWRFMGQLHTAAGRTYCFHLNFFFRNTQNDFLGALPARWFTPRTFSAHFALTDPMNGEAGQTYRFWQRGGLLSRSEGYTDNQRFHVELGGWYVYRKDDGGFVFFASGDDSSLHLDLAPLKELTYHGQSGFTDGASASFYCSYTRLKSSGRLLIDGRLEDVTGITWMDHEKYTGSPPRHSDRIAIQLLSGQDLMVHESDGHATGSWIEADGTVKHLISSDIKIQNIEYWISPNTGARYPIKRQLSIEPLELQLDLKTTVPAQELDANRSTLSSYWSGTLNVSGKLRGAEADGYAYAEMAGYDARPRTRLLEFLTRS